MFLFYLVGGERDRGMIYRMGFNVKARKTKLPARMEFFFLIKN